MTDKIDIKDSLHHQIIMSSFPVVQTKHSQTGRIKKRLMEYDNYHRANIPENESKVMSSKTWNPGQKLCKKTAEVTEFSSSWSS